jgi:hypothetical protein
VRVEDSHVESSDALAARLAAFGIHSRADRTMSSSA